jgi:aminomethyltransferase
MLPEDVTGYRSQDLLMTVIEAAHEAHDAEFVEHGDRRVVAHYGQPERSHAAVRNVVGVTEHCYGVLTVEGDDRVAFVDNSVSNRVPTDDGEGTYGLLLDPQGRIRTDLSVFNGSEAGRLLVFLPAGRAEAVAEDWTGKTFIQDVTIEETTDAFGVFGVYGPRATEKIASVLTGPGSPGSPLSFVRGRMGDVGVSVVRDDGPTGEEGFLVICAAGDADEVFDTLENRGQAAAPFGYRTWETLTLEAGTPLFETELDGRLPNDLGIRTALDFEKGCYVGQEVVSRVENRGRPSQQLVGLALATLPEPGASVSTGDAVVGEVTRAAESPTRGEPIALALVEAEAADRKSVSVHADGSEQTARMESLPFVDGSDVSARLPTYPAD